MLQLSVFYAGYGTLFASLWQVAKDMQSDLLDPKVHGLKISTQVTESQEIAESATLS